MSTATSAPPTNGQHQGDEIRAYWVNAAPKLVEWVGRRLVIRRNVRGGYYWDKKAQKCESFTVKKDITPAVLLTHFKALAPEDVVGVHAIVRDDEGNCWSKWVAVDIDHHGEGVNSGVNLAFALQIASRLKKHGIACLILGSNGAGGIHLLVLFDKPIPSNLAHRFAKWLTKGWKAAGLEECPEAFPKQATIQPPDPDDPRSGRNSFGNWLRLPGRHHKRKAYTQLWDGEKWVDGQPVIDALLTYVPITGEMIPAEAVAEKKKPEPEPEPSPFAGRASNSRRYEGNVGDRTDAEWAEEAIAYLDPNMKYPEWLNIGMALYQLGNDGLRIWDRWSAAGKDYKPDECTSKWATFGDGKTKLGTLFKLAQDAGWPGFPRCESPYVSSGKSPEADEYRREHPEEAAAATPPVIECSDTSLAYATDQTLMAMGRINRPPEVFDVGGQFSWIKLDKDDGRAFIQVMSKYAIRDRLARAATFEQTVDTKQGPVTKEIFPPMDLVHSVMAQKYWSDSVAPSLSMVAESPRFSKDGRLILEPGYHADARIFYMPPPELASLNIPSPPTPAQVETAVRFIVDDYLGDFPFADQASRANAVACMMLPFVRPMIDGATPMHLFEASTEGTGKGLLAQACAFPSLGRDLRSSPQKEDEAEWRKSITSILTGAPSHIYYDNMYNPVNWRDDMLPIDSGTLALAITQRVWTDRILGSSKDFVGKVNVVWMASGNNLEFSKELIRRIVPIRLRTPQQNPCERTGFRCEPDTLEEWARKNRVKLLEACLTICLNWIAEEMTPGKQIMGSFLDYARVMGGILDMAGIRGFLGNLKFKAATSIDRESLRWEALVKEWKTIYGTKPVSSGDLYDVIFGVEGQLPGDADLQVSFADILGEGTPLSRKQKLGHALAKQVDRVWGDRRIVLTEVVTRGGSPIYKLADPSESCQDLGE